MNCHVTASINSQHKQWLHHLLQQFCPAERCLAVVDGQNRVWSMLKSGDGCHFLCTNAFRSDIKRHSEPIRPSFSTQDVSTLSSISISTLSSIAVALGVALDADERKLALAICQHVSSSTTQEQDDSSTSPTISNVPQNQQIVLIPLEAAGNQNSSSSVDRETRYSEEELKSKTMQELNTICQTKYHKKGKRKSESISIIMDGQNITQSDIEGMRGRLSTEHQQIPTLHHQHYRDTFNFVDLHDRWWNELQMNHTIISWRSKFIISILETGLINAFVLYRHLKNVDLLEFCKQIAIDICKNNINL